MRHSKDQDFKYLEESSSTLLNVLRADEGKRRDLDEQFKSRDIGHHRYFVSPYRRAENEWGSMFDVKQMIPLPKIIQDDLNKQVHTASFMGIIPEINRAWVTIDSKIMFWNYLSTTGGQPEVDRYDGLSDVIVSVSLSAPKSGVFLDTVKYVLVIATTVEVVILAVSWSDNGNHDLKIIPTAYTIASDNITMFKVIGSQSGRIFMGGQDGLLYELDYDHRENKLARLLGFESAGDGSSGRGSGSSIFGGGGATKCQKLNHNAWSWRAILPPFIRSLLLGDESLTDLVVDDFRHLLYAVTSTNNIRVVYLGLENKATVCLINSLNLMQGIKYFLSYTGRNLDSVPRMDFFQDDVDSVNIVGFYIAPITESKNVHAVVVLQSGTRVYLQLNTWSTTTGSNISTTASGSGGSNISNSFNPNINNSYSNNDSNNNPYANINRRMFGPYHPTNNHTHSACQLEAQDAKLEIVFIRGPPTQDAILDSLHSLDATHDIGYLPTNTLPSNKENKLKISASYYAHGVFLTAVNNKDSLLPDELLGVGEDLTNRKIGVVSSGMTGGSGSGGSGNVMNMRYDALLPSLRESVSIINSMQGKQMLNYKIFDIKESCRPIVLPSSMNKYAPFYSLYFSSASPVASEVKEQSSFRLIGNGGIGGSLISSSSNVVGNVTSNVIQNVFKSIHNVGSDGSASSVLPPLCYSSAVAPSGSSGTSSSSSGSTLGVTKTSQVSHVTPLTEFTLQSMSIPNQRQFLCLTRYGIIVIAKNRPIDYLSKLLLTHDGNLDHPAYYEKMDSFFRYFGHEESCAMCLELICGVPDDVLISSSGGSTDNVHSVTGMTVGSGVSGDGSGSGNSKILRDRALRVILRFGGCPGFETIGRGGSSGGGGLSDSRLSAGTLTPNFFCSHKHDAVLLVCSRLLRPIWLRPVVDNKNLAVIWTPFLISTMKSVIERLLHFLRDFYPTAVTQDVFMNLATERLKNSNISSGSSGDSNMSYVNSGLLTERLARQQATTILDPMRQFQKDASDREDVSIHSIWRLLHRSDQALILLQILLVLQNIHKIPINWSDGIGHNTTFRSLVVSSNIHDKIKKLLHTVIHTLTKSSSSKIDKRNEPVADDVTKKLTEDCYLYFSIGDRYAYEAARYLETIRAQLSVNNDITGCSGSRQQQVVPKQMIKSQTDGLIFLLLKASKYWVSLADVKDEIPTFSSTNNANGATAGNGTKKTTAPSATVAGTSSSSVSQLTLYCNMLSQLGSVGGIGIVHLCLSVAQNFDAKSSTTTTGAFSPLKLTAGGGVDDFSTSVSGGRGSDWERQLYHMGQILTDEEKKEGRELCYTCLIRYLEYALASTSTTTSTTSAFSPSLAPLSSLSVDDKTAGIMIDEILANSTDPLLRDMVYNTLLKLNFEGLLQIESIDVQDFLARVDAQSADSDCLYRYYESHGMHREAANYIYSLAHAEDAAVTRHVEQRLKFLQLAVDSATRACEFPSGMSGGGSDSVPLALTAAGGGVGGESMLSINQRTAGAYADFLGEVKDEVIILGYQIEAYQEVVAYKNEYFPSGTSSSGGNHDHQQQQQHLDEMSLIDITRILNNLERKCMPISELFNDVLLPFHLWTLALCVLKHSGLDAPDAAQKLWKSIIYRKIPLEALTAEGKSFLSQQRAPDSIFIDSRHQCCQGYFENTSYWLSDLESSILATGLKLYNHHLHGSADSSGSSGGLVLTSHMFYAEKLLELLEELSIQLTICGNPVGNGWAVRIFLQFPSTSFSYAVLVDMYVKLLESWIGSPIERMIQVISSLTFVLSKWVNIVYERNRSNESDRMQLIQTIRSGYLHEWLNKMDRQINLMRASSSRITDTSQERLTDAIETVVKIRKMISDFTT